MFFIEYIKRYYKYILVGIISLILVGLIIYYNVNSINNKPKVEKKTIEERKEKKEVTLKEEITYYYVDVKGAVNNPGVYKLEENKRVIDAINNAGGIREDADTSIINLSKKIIDEMCIVVYTKDEIAKFKEKNITVNEIVNEIHKENNIKDSFNDAKVEYNNITSIDSETNTNSKISINTATKEELLSLSGIGDSKADAIIKYREETGLFKQIEDIKNVSGIGDALYEKIKDNITI